MCNVFFLVVSFVLSCEYFFWSFFCFCIFLVCVLLLFFFFFGRFEDGKSRRVDSRCQTDISMTPLGCVIISPLHCMSLFLFISVFFSPCFFLARSFLLPLQFYFISTSSLLLLLSFKGLRFSRFFSLLCLKFGRLLCFEQKNKRGKKRLHFIAHFNVHNNTFTSWAISTVEFVI